MLNCLEADLLEVVNASLLSGTFPSSLKTAVVKPLLEKRNLDNTILSNYNWAVVGLMDRALDLKPEVTQGCGFESWLRQEVHDCSPGAAQSAAHCSKCVHLDGLNAENTFHSSLYSV